MQNLDPYISRGDAKSRMSRCRTQFKLFNAAIKNKVEFAKRFTEEIAILNETLYEEKWLVADFQIMIDRKVNLHPTFLNNSTITNSSSPNITSSLSSSYSYYSSSFFFHSLSLHIKLPLSLFFNIYFNQSIDQSINQ